MTTPAGAFPRNVALTAIAIAYKNPDVALIADKIFPRSPVGTQEFKWTEYPLAQNFTIPDTKVGRDSPVNTVQLSGADRTSSTEAEGLGILISNEDVKNAPQGIDPKDGATEYLTNITLLRRELRCATIAFGAASYDADQKVDLATLDGGIHQFDDPDHDPLLFLRAQLNSMLTRGNVVTFGNDGWEKFATHPAVVSAALGNDGTKGIATKQRVAELLEVSEILVGSGWLNTAKPGLAPAMSRVWGNHCLAFFRDSTAGFGNKAVTFGLTAQWGDRMAGSVQIPAGEAGLLGGEKVIVGEYVKECVIAKPCARLLQNVI